MEAFFQIGVIASTHGVRGEVKVFPTTDDVRRFQKGMEVLLDTGDGRTPLTVEHVKFFKQFAILKFRGIDSLDEVQRYRGKSLFVPRSQAVALQEDEYFIADLIGMEVQDEQGVRIGVLRDVLTTGANDVYVIDLDEGRELLLPAIRECVRGVQVEEGRMQVRLLPGL